MPSYRLNWTLWRDIYPIPLFAIMVALILAKLVCEPNSFKRYFIVIFAMALLGIVTGQVTGQSRDPAVGAVIPSVLGLIGAVVVYLLGSKEEKTQLIIAASIIALTFNLLVGIMWGARLRVDYDNAIAKFKTSEWYLLENERVNHIVELQRLLYEKEIQDIRKHFNITLMNQNTPKKK